MTFIPTLEIVCVNKHKIKIYWLKNSIFIQSNQLNNFADFLFYLIMMVHNTEALALMKFKIMRDLQVI